MAHTSIFKTGPSTVAVSEHVVIEVQAGARDPDGGGFTIATSRDSLETCNIGDCVKYVNIHIQTTPTSNASEKEGWLEYAVVHKKEDVPILDNTNLGILTLGNAATNYLRNQVLWTGFIPQGQAVANGAELHLKLPKQFQKITLGDQLLVWLYFRSASSTDTSTDNARYIVSHNYKVYY